jgi:hypothetical protein
MAHAIAKQTDVVLVGDSPLMKLIHRLVLEHTKNCITTGTEEFRFLNENIVSINGTKVFAKKVVILKKLHSTLPDIAGLKKAVHKKNASSVLVIGNNSTTYSEALESIKSGKTTHIATMTDRILEKYDSSVQEVCERYLKKLGIKIHYQTTVLSVASTNEKNFIVCESSGIPKRLVAEDIRYFGNGTWEDADVIGLSNTSLVTEMDTIKSATTIQRGAGNALIIPAETSYTLSDIEYVIDFIKDGKYRHGQTLEFHEEECESYRFFTVGIKEQDIAGEHIAYKKSVAKISVAEYDGPTLFLKVMTSTRKNIVGISGIVPGNTETSVFRYIVEENMNIIEARRLIDATSPLALAFHDITENLS